MKKFRITWLVIVALAVVLFVGYRIAQIRRTDSSGPVISCDEEELEISIADGEDVLLEGVTASDRKDGDVTSSILVEGLSSFYDGGKRIVTYAAFDSDNHISKMQREVTYTDYVSPRFELTGSLRFRAGETVNVDQIVKATDCLDGDISNKVKILMNEAINNRVTGRYQITYEVSNSAGDTATLPIEIEIYEASGNEVELNLSQYLVYYDGQPIDYTDYLQSVRAGSIEYPFEGVDLEETVDTEGELAEEDMTEDTPENASDNGTEEGQEEQQTVSGSTIPRSRVSVRSTQVNTAVPGVYPVYLYYSDTDEGYEREATEIMYVVVE